MVELATAFDGCVFMATDRYTYEGCVCVWGGGGGAGDMGPLSTVCVNPNSKEIGPFLSFKQLERMDKFPFKIVVKLALSFIIGIFCLCFPFIISHIFNFIN